MKTDAIVVCVYAMLLMFGVSAPVFASDVLITPLLLDFEVEPRDIVEREVTVANQSDRKVVLFATVNEVAVDSTGEIKEFVSPVMTDRTKTVTSWIEITRGRIELEPGEVRAVPITIRIHPYAEYGSYFAFIGFVESSKRPEAEAVALKGEADGTILKIELKDTTVQSLRIVEYATDRFIFNDKNLGVTVQIENTGTKEAVPMGEVIFYNSRGEEVSAAFLNQSNEVIQPGETKAVELTIPFSDKLGRFKANLSLQSGNAQAASVFDTVQFYMIPYRILVMLVFGILATTILITFLIRRVFQEDMHDDESTAVPLYIRNDREHTEHKHDIHIKK
jgi:hypothetical protein